MGELDPGKGWGKPGSLKWSIAVIASCDTSWQLSKFIGSLTGIPLNTDNRFSVVKKDALRIVREYFDDS